MTAQLHPIQSNQALTLLLKAVADDLRLAILQVLATDSYGVSELAQGFEVKQSGMSHHLKILATAGLIDSRREGNSIFYKRSALAPGAPHTDIKKALFAQIDQAPLSTELRNRLEHIWQERAATSKRFFVENATKFRDQQDLIANFEVYQEQVTEILDISPIPNRQHALEVGPGQGEFLLALSERFAQVNAIDNSAEMLESARNTLIEHDIHNVTLTLGDAENLESCNDPFSLAVLNMVLHHTPAPSRIFHHLSRVMEPAGVLLVTDLCLHHQSWAQQACGDIWLGFTPNDLIEWAKDAGFEHGQGIYFALRNGFQIQIHQFIKSSN